MKQKKKLTKTIQLWGIILIIPVFCNALLLDTLQPIRFAYGCGYYFISRFDGNAILHAAQEIEKGTGLGLAVIPGIIKQHPGAIIGSSSPGRGSVFHVNLPTISSEALPTPHATVIPMPQGTEHILLVGDEEAITHMMRRMLTAPGYKVTALNNSIWAVKTLNTSPDSFNILITDITIPGMTGKTLAAKNLNRQPGFPIIICTGFSENLDEAQDKSLGICEFIMKPILKEPLAITVRKVLDHG